MGRTSAGRSLHFEQSACAAIAGSAEACPFSAGPRPSVSHARCKRAPFSSPARQPFAWQLDPLQPAGAFTSSKSSSVSEHMRRD